MLQTWPLAVGGGNGCKVYIRYEKIRICCKFSSCVQLCALRVVLVADSLEIQQQKFSGMRLFVSSYIVRLSVRNTAELISVICDDLRGVPKLLAIYEGWNFNSGNYLFTTDTK